MSMDRTTDAHRAMAQLFKNPDPRSLGVMDFIFDVYPLFYRKIFKNNTLMERVVMTGLNGMDILDYFVCGRCESIAPQSGTVLKDGVFVPQCTCTADGCGATTVNPPTLREWLMYELRKKAPPGFETILSMAMNNIAQTYLRKALKDYKQAEDFQTMLDAKRLGMPDMKPLPEMGPVKPRVEHYEGMPTDEELEEIVQRDVKELMQRVSHKKE